METSKEEARQKVAELVDKYRRLDGKAIGSFSEADTRRIFIMPLFQALGWSVLDHDEVAEEVKAGSGRVDYVFKLCGVSQFYLEAKALKVDLTRQEHIKQAITYAYNRGITWACLSGFKGLQIYNSQTGRAFVNLTCDRYLTDFDDLWLLSKESFQRNALSEQAERYGALPPRLGIESRLFGQLRLWREDLYSQVYFHNRELDLSHAQIDEIIERLFNRLIFIRTCEDRRIEDPILLESIRRRQSGNTKSEYVEDLRLIFREFDGYYDSDLFRHHLVDKVYIETPTLEHIVRGLYDLPGGMASYDFSLIDVDVLGAVYEQYLGHVASVVRCQAENTQRQMDLGIPTKPTIEVTARRQRRKEHGIYYTPRFVTDYIVRETVGRSLQENRYGEIRNIRILDPACGSGSFLIRAYDELLAYHARQRGKSSVQLDQWDRLPILTSNIFGVDLDMQAVEIARLNLLLRSLARRQLLPSLADNIRHGNSLISGPEEELAGFFGESWRDKKPFNWVKEYKDIMGEGGFDVVIGNPPYVRIQSLPRDEADYYRQKYESAHGSFDIYVLFLERALEVLKAGGRLGYITSGKFLKSTYGEKIRKILHNRCTVENIVDLSAQQVFAEATTYPVIIVLKKGKEDTPLTYTSVRGDVDLFKAPRSIESLSLPTVLADQEAVVEGIFPPEGTDDTLFAEISRNTLPLRELSARIFVGLQTSADRVYILDKRGTPSEGKVRVYSDSIEQSFVLEHSVLKPLLSGKDVERYGYPIPERVLLFPYDVKDGRAELIPPERFEREYPNCWQYLLQNREVLENREKGKMKHDRWYAFGRTQNLGMHEYRKLAVPRLVDRLEAIYDREGQFYLDNVDVGGIILKDADDSDYLYVTGLLNSRLLDYYLHRISVPFRGGFYSANRQFLEPLPIRTIVEGDEAGKRIRDEIVSLVSKMLELHKRLAPIRNTPYSGRDELQREIESLDAEIDQKVYELYGITEEGRQTIESYLRK